MGLIFSSEPEVTGADVLQTGISSSKSVQGKKSFPEMEFAVSNQTCKSLSASDSSKSSLSFRRTKFKRFCSTRLGRRRRQRQRKQRWQLRSQIRDSCSDNSAEKGETAGESPSEQYDKRACSCLHVVDDEFLPDYTTQLVGNTIQMQWPGTFGLW